MSKTRVSPVQRSLKWARDNGYLAAVVEHWNPHAFIRQDLFGIFDLLVVDPLGVCGIAGIQVKGHESVAPGKAKIEATDAAKAWLAAGGHIELWAWRKRAVAPQPGVKRDRKAKVRFELTRFVAEAAPGNSIFWTEEE